MSNIDAIINHAENSCKSHGARLTNKRKQVLSGLLNTGKAMSAYELVDYCRNEFGETLPPMSVYRILEFLQEEHLVHKLNTANKYIACSHIACDHAHGIPQFLICGNCQRVEEITIDKSTIDALQQNVEEAGFSLVSPQLEMNCLCSGCALD
ncbi:MAG: transcriptional repressor [Cellvibrionaceae bacterium]